MGWYRRMSDGHTVLDDGRGNIVADYNPVADSWPIAPGMSLKHERVTSKTTVDPNGVYRLKGSNATNETIEVYLPYGVDNGAQVVLSLRSGNGSVYLYGEGDATVNGGDGFEMSSANGWIWANCYYDDVAHDWLLLEPNVSGDINYVI